MIVSKGDKKIPDLIVGNYKFEIVNWFRPNLDRCNLIQILVQVN